MMETVVCPIRTIMSLIDIFCSTQPRTEAFDFIKGWMANCNLRDYMWTDLDTEIDNI